MEHKKHRVRLFTWANGRLFTEDYFTDLLEEAKALARSRGPHSFKIYDVLSGEILFTEICDQSVPLVPDYA